MTKKVLILSGSPRKGGNSDLLCDAFAKGAAEKGHQVGKVFLAQQKIAYCSGCGICQNTGKCVIQDDMSAIMDKMVDADVLVFATPIYFYNMSAQMKTLIDRCCPRYTEMKDKALYLLMTAFDDSKNTTDTTIAGFQSFLDCLDGGEIKDSLFASGVHALGEVKDTPFMKKAYQMGGSI